MKVLIFQFVLLLSIFHANAQKWEYIYPDSSIHTDLVKVFIPPNSDKIYAIGNFVAISDNLGNSWRKITSDSLPYQRSDVSSTNFDIKFLSESNAYMVNKNNIYYSTDTGATWSNQLSLKSKHPQYASNAYFSAIHFPDRNTGYAVGPFGKIFKTNNGGASWDTLSWSTSTIPYRRYSDVFFFNKDTGYVTGYDVPDILMNFGFMEFIAKTTDGGKNWKTYNVNTGIDYQKILLNMKNEQTGFLFYSITQSIEKILVTNDSAKTWTDVSPASIQSIKCVTWIDTNTGIFYGQNLDDSYPKFYKTTNRGQSWYKVPVPDSQAVSDYSVKDIVFANKTTGFAVGSHGGIYVTLDGGESWQIKNKSSIIFSQIEFASNSDFFANSQKGIVTSVDSGYTWTDNKAATDSMKNLILSIGFADEQRGYAIGYGNTFYRTTDGFKTIEVDSLPVSFLLFYKYMQINNNTIYIAGRTLPYSTGPNVLLYSADNGDSWKIDTISSGGINNSLTSLQATNNTLFAATTNDIFVADNVEHSWKALFHSDNPFYNTTFLNENIGYSNYADGTVIKTTDGGKSWNSIPINHDNTSIDIRGFLPIDTALVYAYGSEYNLQLRATIWQSKNGGVTWQKNSLPIRIDGQIIKMNSKNDFIYAISSQGELLRLKRGNPTVDNVTDMLSKKKLQTFPNPASNDITIKSNSKISIIRIYNTMGVLTREIQSMQNDVSLDISEFSEGMYIISAVTDEGLQNALFIKVK